MQVSDVYLSPLVHFIWSINIQRLLSIISKAMTVVSGKILAAVYAAFSSVRQQKQIKH